METALAAPKPRGRPRAFDRETALHQAMLVFWRHGYEGSSINDLTAAMGVTAPSLYSAFGDKRGLFREAVARYLSPAGTPMAVSTEAATAKEAAWALLRGSAIVYTGIETPPGCLMSTAAISCSSAAADIQSELASVRREVEQRLAHSIAAGIERGEAPADTDADALAAYVMTVVQGLSTLARDGGSREKLLQVCEVAMRAWPLAPSTASS